MCCADGGCRCSSCGTQPQDGHHTWGHSSRALLLSCRVRSPRRPGDMRLSPGGCSSPCHQEGVLPRGCPTLCTMSRPHPAGRLTPRSQQAATSRCWERSRFFVWANLLLCFLQAILIVIKTQQPAGKEHPGVEELSGSQGSGWVSASRCVALGFPP